MVYVFLTGYSIAQQPELQPTSSIVKALAIKHNRPIAFNAQALATFHHRPAPAHFTLSEALTFVLADTDMTFRISDAGVSIFPDPVSLHTTDSSTQQSELEEITVVGKTTSVALQTLDTHYTQAQSTALSMKQRRPEESDYLVGAMLKALPAENLAESMQVFSGLNISRDRGEGLSITALGLGAEYQQTLLNGRRIANTENVRNSTQQGTLYRFDTLSAGVFSAVELVKSADVTMPSGAIGAVANILGDNPLLHTQNGVEFKVGASWLQGEFTAEPAISLNSHWKNEHSTLGVISTLSIQKRNQRQYQYESWNWGNNGGSLAQYHYDDLAPETMVPTGGMALTIENEDRSRLSHYLSVHWQPASLPNDIFTQEWAIKWLHSNTNFDFDEHRLGVNPLSSTAIPESLGVSQQALSQARYQQADVKSSRELSTLNYLHNTWQFDGTLTKQLKKGELSLMPFASLSEAASTTETPITRLHVALVPATVTFAQSANTLEQLTIQSSPVEPSQFSHFSKISQRLLNVSNRVDEWGINTRITPHEHTWQVDSGLLQTRQQHQYVRKDIQLSEQLLATLDPANRNYYEALPSSFEASFAKQVTPDWLLAAPDIIDMFSDSLAFGPSTTNDLLNSYRVTLLMREGFLNTSWYGSEITLVAGLRYTSTQSESSGYGIKQAAVEPINTRTHYHHWLPALSMQWQLSSLWHWRSSITRSLVRPNYAYLNPKLHVNSSGLPYAEGGNPYLTPITAINFSTSISVVTPSLNASAMLFSKHLKDYIAPREQTLIYNGLSYSLLTQSNNNSARVGGVEFSATTSFAPGVLTENMLSLSATWVDQQGKFNNNHQTETFNLEGVSDISGNLRWVWGIEGLQGAVNINYRSDYLEIRDTSNNADIWVDDFTSVDASLAYQFNNVQLRMDLYNLFNEVKARYYKSEYATALMKLEEYGSRFSLSIQVNW
ncbi:TonB-dependent receptor domain-containing protein [Aestuariibacter sp. GS-14]|uniref:TonB-dependent receptor domain-containing protein n=1 Tax=Aestuariibacter sp. GS-14 TaxID=2590670 RepID=UPI0015E85382|nr:TonB-dependent receptor [Aestuariibacter sp. GS-14]